MLFCPMLATVGRYTVTSRLMLSYCSQQIIFFSKVFATVFDQTHGGFENWVRPNGEGQ